MTCMTTGTDSNETWVAKDGAPIVIRPICPEDEPLMTRFHRGLSPESVYTRYFNAMKLSSRTAHQRLSGVCHPDADRATVLVAERAAPAAERRIVGVGRLSRVPELNAAEVALIVSDDHQRRGIGAELMRRLIETAKGWGVARLYAHILPANIAMQRLCAAAGLRLHVLPGADEVKGIMEL